MVLGIDFLRFPTRQEFPTHFNGNDQQKTTEDIKHPFESLDKSAGNKNENKTKDKGTQYSPKKNFFVEPCWDIK